MWKTLLTLIFALLALFISMIHYFGLLCFGLFVLLPILFIGTLFKPLASAFYQKQKILELDQEIFSRFAIWGHVLAHPQLKEEKKEYLEFAKRCHGNPNLMTSPYYYFIKMGNSTVLEKIHKYSHAHEPFEVLEEDFEGNNILHHICKLHPDQADKMIATISKDTRIFRSDQVRKLFVEPNNKGETPMVLSMQNSLTNIIDIFGYDAIGRLVQDKSKRNCLHYACASGNSTVALNLMQKIHEELFRRFDINAQDAQGKTPLHLACENGHLDIVQLFLTYHQELNIDLKCHDFGNKRPIDILLLRANSEGVDLATSRLGHICYELAIYSNDDEALEHLSELAKKEPVLSEQSDHLLSDFEVVY